MALSIWKQPGEGGGVRVQPLEEAGRATYHGHGWRWQRAFGDPTRPTAVASDIQFYLGVAVLALLPSATFLSHLHLAKYA